MVKIRIGTTISILVNLFLTFWLVNQYLNDIYFQNYVNSSIGPYSPFIVLTIGLGGGSGFGYVLLKRRHGDQGLVGKIQKSKSFKPGSLLSTGSPTASPSRQILPTGAPPSAGSKHTVYAVPPLPKSSTPSSPRASPSLTWSTGAKSSTDTFPAQKKDTVGKSASAVLQTLRAEASKPTSSPFQPTPQNQPSPTYRPSTDQSPRPGPSPAWNPPPSTMDNRRSESGPVFQKPGIDTSARQGAPFPPSPAQPPSSQSSAVPSKWTPPDPPRPFGAGPPRPPPGMGPQPGQGQAGPRPPPPLGGPMPMPQPWKPPTQTPDKESPDSSEKPQSFGDLSSTKPGAESKNPPAATGGGGEMDWDTALDTILKTLRKDRGVGEAK